MADVNAVSAVKTPVVQPQVDPKKAGEAKKSDKSEAPVLGTDNNAAPAAVAPEGSAPKAQVPAEVGKKLDVQG